MILTFSEQKKQENDGERITNNRGKSLPNGEELPKPYKVGAALNKYLEGKEYWEQLRKKKNVSSYSFRHTYSKRLHLEYGMDNKSASDLMGHTEEVHIKNYKDKWGNNKESIMEKAMLYRDLHTTKGKRIASTL